MWTLFIALTTVGNSTLEQTFHFKTEKECRKYEEGFKDNITKDIDADHPSFKMGLYWCVKEGK